MSFNLICVYRSYAYIQRAQCALKRLSKSFIHGNGSDRAPQDSRLRSQKGGVEFINFPFGSFGSEICSEQLLESGLGSKRANTDRAVDPELKNREISFLTRILGRMTPICIFIYKTPNIVHKGPI